MGQAALVNAGFKDATGKWTEFAKKFGVIDDETFLNSPQAQEYAIRANHMVVWNEIKNKNLIKYVGTTFVGTVKGTNIRVTIFITESGLLAASHLVGTGALSNMFETGIIPVDGNNVAATTYMLNFGGYDLSDLFDWKP
jgi:glycerol dehydrogenase-like iron-containing ADH family enzyme